MPLQRLGVGGTDRPAMALTHEQKEARRRIKSAWKLISRVLLYLVYVGVAVNTCWTVVQLAQGRDAHTVATSIGAVFVSITLPLSVHDIHMHVLNYKSALQRHYIRILLMPAIYSCESYLALAYPEHRVYLETARECYEAFALYSFLKLLIEYLGPREKLIARLEGRLDPPSLVPDAADISRRNSGRATPPRGLSAKMLNWLASPPQLSSRPRDDSEGPAALDIPAQDEDDEGMAGGGTAVKGESPLKPDALTPLRSAAYGPAGGGQRSMDDDSLPTGAREDGDAELAVAAADNAATIESVKLFGLMGSHRRSGGAGASTMYSQVPDGRATMLAPFCCLPRWRFPQPFLFRTSSGVLQYVIVRVTTSIITFALEAVGKYREGDFHDASAGYVWMIIILNVSQAWALWCLAMFAFHLWPHLSQLRPLSKFSVIKFVVFICWWQQVIIAGLASLRVLPDVLGYAQDDVAAALQDLLITAEMAVIAVAHHYVWTYKEFRQAHMQQHLAGAASNPQVVVTSASKLSQPGSGHVAPGTAAFIAGVATAPTPSATSVSPHKKGVVAALADMVPVDVVVDSVHAVHETARWSAAAVEGVVKGAVRKVRGSTSTSAGYGRPSAASDADATIDTDQGSLL